LIKEAQVKARKVAFTDVPSFVLVIENAECFGEFEVIVARILIDEQRTEGEKSQVYNEINPEPFVSSLVGNSLIVVPTKKVKQPLSVTHPDLAKSADGWDPTEVFAQIGTGRKFKWKCLEGHRYLATLGNRVLHKSGCPYCSGHKVLAGFNDLATTHPKIAKSADGWDPKTVSAGSHKKVNWVCNIGHSYAAIVKSRIRNVDGGCPICANKKVLAGFNDLATTHPLIAKEADGWDPKKVVAGSNKKLQWRCELGHIWFMSPNKRTGRGDACLICGSHKILFGFNDLATTHPMIAAEADGWDPTTIFAGSNKKFKWKCPVGHSYQTSPNGRALRGNDCSICSNQKVLSGFNDLATTHPELAKEAYGWDPKTVIGGTHKKLTWRCSDGHIFKQAVVNRTRRESGCPACATSGYDPYADGYLYFLTHTDWEMYQIGITNYPKERLKKHKNLGWEISETRGPIEGHLARQWETAILRMLKARGADLSNDKIAGKFDGYTEAWSKSTFEVKSIMELMQLTEEFEA